MYLIAINGPALTTLLTSCIAAISDSPSTLGILRSGTSSELTVHFCAQFAVDLRFAPNASFTGLSRSPTPGDVAWRRRACLSRLVTRENRGRSLNWVQWPSRAL